MPIEKLINRVYFIATEIGYLTAGIFYAVAFPLMNYSAPMNSVIGKVRFTISAYSLAIGFLYLIITYYIARRKIIALRLMIIANILGIFLILPIILGLMSLYTFTQAEIKEQFK